MGTISGVVSRGSLIAAERSIGWTRQMRITPLRAGAYFGAKVLCGYLMALLTVGVMCLAGAVMGVRLSAGAWLAFAGLLLVGLVPFAVLGILLGHLLKPEALLPAVAGITTLLALLGGAYGFLVATSGPVFEAIRALPSYWLVQAGKAALGHGGWPAEGWIVVAAWTAVLAPAHRAGVPARYEPWSERALGRANLDERGRRYRAGERGRGAVVRQPAEVGPGLAAFRHGRAPGRLPGLSRSGGDKNSHGYGQAAGYAVAAAFAACWLAAPLVLSAEAAPARRFWPYWGLLGILFLAELPFARAAAFVMCVFLTILIVGRLGARSAPVVAGLAAAALIVPVAVPSWHVSLGRLVRRHLAGRDPGRRPRDIRGSAGAARQSGPGRGAGRARAAGGGERAHPDRPRPPRPARPLADHDHGQGRAGQPAGNGGSGPAPPSARSPRWRHWPGRHSATCARRSPTTAM